MILTCPNCGTQYVVKDDAIPPEGRQVRCAACKHSWHQDPEAEAAQTTAEPEEPVVDDEREDIEAAADAEPQDESVAEATMIDPRSGPEAEERAYEEALADDAEAAAPEGPILSDAALDDTGPSAGGAAPPQEDWNEPPEAEAAPDIFSPFAAEDEMPAPRRRPLLTILIITLVVIAAAAAFWFLAPPDLKAKLGIAGAGATSLQLITTHMDRHPLESGNDLLTVTGRVINPTGEEQLVPPLQAQLKDRAGKIVASWTIEPPVRSLPPGASASFNSAEVDVPPAADELTITLTEPKA
jgi:predicted Zn finger-like uncharacterized protein